MANKKLGERIKKYRKISGLTRQQLSDILGLKNKTTLSSWEVGKSEPDFFMIHKLCEVFDISANTFFDREERGASGNDALFISDEPHKTAFQKYLNLNPEHQASIRGLIDGYTAKEEMAATSLKKSIQAG